MGSQTEALMVPTFDPEAVEQLKEALLQVATAIRNVVRQIVEAIAPAIRVMMQQLTRLFCDLLQLVATPKDWHIYKHTKKRRIREKYRKRLTRRLMALLSEARTSGDG